MNRFTDLIGFEPADLPARKPAAAQIAATGRALPPGEHVLTPEQQRAWFGRVAFAGPVAWDGDAFVSEGRRLTPDEVANG